MAKDSTVIITSDGKTVSMSGVVTGAIAVGDGAKASGSTTVIVNKK